MKRAGPPGRACYRILLCYSWKFGFSGFPDFRNEPPSMRTLVKVQPKGQMTIPSRVRSAVGLTDGDLVEVKAVGRRIVITPQLVIDRSKFPTADDEYTPAQRRAIDARLDEAEKGPFHGPFRNGAEVAAFLKKTQRNVKPARLKRAR